MTARLRPLALLALVALAGGVARAERLPMQADVDRCAVRATDLGQADLQGRIRLQLLLRQDGQVYAAFIHSESGVRSTALEHCLAETALLWQYGAQAVDGTAPFPLSLIAGGTESAGPSTQVGKHQGATPPQVFMPASRPAVEPTELDEKLARSSLTMLESVTQAEAGLAHLAVRSFSEAIAAFRGALARDAADPLALRGLSQALVESGGDLAEARALAGRLAAAAPGSVVAPEALLRVCAAQRDDACVFEQWQKARGAGDLAPRSRVVAELQPVVQAAADRLREASRARAGTAPATGAPGSGSGAAAAPVAGDPCAAEPGEEKQVLCAIKRCFDAGSADYAKELSAQNGVDYIAGDWRTKVVGPGRMLATRPIASRAREPGDRHDAIWLIKLGDQLSITPSTSEARQITLSRNACARR